MPESVSERGLSAQRRSPTNVKNVAAQYQLVDDGAKLWWHESNRDGALPGSDLLAISTRDGRNSEPYTYVALVAPAEMRRSVVSVSWSTSNVEFGASMPAVEALPSGVAAVRLPVAAVLASIVSVAEILVVCAFIAAAFPS